MSTDQPSFFTRHLRSIDESYFVHMRHALYFCANCFAAAIALLIHSLLPFIFVTNGSSIIKKLHQIMSVRAQVITLVHNKEKHVAIVGFGLSGLLAFLNLVENYQKSDKLIIRIFERSRFFAKGIAYSTKNINHLLNVVAEKMGVESNDRKHFYKWLVSKGYNYGEKDFVPRQIFGIYLQDVLESALKIAQEKNISYEFINKEINDIGIKNNHYLIDGNAYNYCILAVGVRLKNWRHNFWHVDLTKYLQQKEIHITGCGLTAIDAAISLRDLNYDGAIFIHSRSNRLPQIHQINTALPQNVISPLTLDDAHLPLSLIYQKFVKACKNSTNWQATFDSFRPLSQSFWQALDSKKKKCFLRHCFRLWNIHRHRCPQVQYEAIQQMVTANKLIFTKGRAGESAIDCTGFDYGYKSELLKSLLKNHIVENDAIAAGIVSLKDNFFIMGGLNFGSTFEITAVPDIAPQAHKIATEILS